MTGITPADGWDKIIAAADDPRMVGSALIASGRGIGGWRASSNMAEACVSCANWATIREKLTGGDGWRQLAPQTSNWGEPEPGRFARYVLVYPPGVVIALCPQCCQQWTLAAAHNDQLPKAAAVLPI